MMISLKLQYAIGTSGFILMAFSAGMITMGTVVGYPGVSWLGAVMMGLFMVGMGITIKMLSTMKKIELLVEDVEDE